MKENKNAVVTAKETKKGYKVLEMELELSNKEVVKCEILLNPYNKKGLGKLYYKICHNLK